MADAETVRVMRVKGYREFVRATNRAGLESRRAVRTAFREIGEPVRAEAQRLFEKYDARSAAAFRIGVTQRGVFVEQGIRKTTGTSPDYGALQMRKALVPALRLKHTDVEKAMERALDGVADHFDRN